MTSRPSRSRRRSRTASFALRPIVAFLLVASFGILFAGCGEPPDEFVITDRDAQEFRELAGRAEEDFRAMGSGSAISRSSDPVLIDAGLGGGTGATIASSTGVTPDRGTMLEVPELDLSRVALYKSIRVTSMAGGDQYVVLAEGLPLRAEPSTRGQVLKKLTRGSPVAVSEFVDGSWVKVKAGDASGFVALKSIAKPVSNDRLAEEKRRFDGMYYVNFGFVNVRATADAKSEKLGTIPGQSIVRPSSVDGEWAKVPFQGKDAFVSLSYLAKFSPTFLVRQERFTLPILLYDASGSGSLQALAGHANALRGQGVTFLTLRSLRDLLVDKGEDARLEGKNVVVAVTGVTPANVRSVSDALGSAGVRGTLFLRSDQLGLRGITEKTVLTLLANGNDVQSATHAGSDLRSLTNAQAELELKQSRKLLEEFARREVFAVAYPQGGVNDRVTDLAAEAGYLFGVGTAPEKSFTREQLLRLPSFPIFPSMSTDEIVRIVSGS